MKITRWIEVSYFLYHFDIKPVRSLTLIAYGCLCPLPLLRPVKAHKFVALKGSWKIWTNASLSYPTLYRIRREQQDIYQHHSFHKGSLCPLQYNHPSCHIAIIVAVHMLMWTFTIDHIVVFLWGAWPAYLSQTKIGSHFFFVCVLSTERSGTCKVKMDIKDRRLLVCCIVVYHIYS